jgi:zinc protease
VNTVSEAKPTLSTETFRRQSPPPLAPRPLNIPAPFETTLDNGLRLVIVEDRRLPLVSFRLAFYSGDANDPADIPGLSDMMSHLMTEGTESRTSLRIAEDIERLGATLAISSSSDFTTVGASALSIYADEILELLADVTLRPSFPQNEIELARENTKQMLIQQRAQPTFLASERMAKVMFGNHPYARISPTGASLDAMSREKFVDFHRKHILPNNAVMLVVGDIDREPMIQSIEQLFRHWEQSAKPETPVSETPSHSFRSTYLVDRPGSAQSNIVIANAGIKRTSPDYFPMLLMHTVLGANASSRLFMNLREEKGYTYGAYSGLDARRLAGTFRVSAEVRTPVTGASVHEFFFELNRIRDEKVPEPELRNAKSYLSGVFPIRIETQDGLVDQLVSVRMFNLPTNYLNTYREMVNAVTADDIQSMAQKYAQVDRATVVIVGDAAEVEPQVREYADAIEVYDTEGNRKR